jgi:FkbM family methyltransferase
MKIAEFLEKNKEEFKPWLEYNDQGRIELKILKYLTDIENGVFVEAGAHDGLFQSNTKILEDLGWSGILVEPSESAFYQCKQNRKCVVENAALVSFDYEDEYISGSFDGSPRSAPLNGSYASPAKTLDSILKKHNLKNIDLLSLDVEGFEMEVLKGINFNEVNFKFMLIEVNVYSYSLEELETFLLSKGYKNIANISNFRTDNTPGWPGNHQDYLFKKI